MKPISVVRFFAFFSLFVLTRQSCLGAEVAMESRKLAKKIATLVGLPFYGISGSEGGKILIEESNENICYLLERAARVGLMVPHLAGVSKGYLQFGMLQTGEMTDCIAFSGGLVVSGVIVQRGDLLEVHVIYDTNADKIESVTLIGKDKKPIKTDLQKSEIYTNKTVKITEIDSLSVTFSTGYVDGIIFQVDEKGKVIDEEKSNKLIQVSTSVGIDDGLTIEIGKIVPSKYRDVSVSQFFAVDEKGNGSGYDSLLNGNNEKPLASIFFTAQRLKSFKIATCRIALDYSNSQFTVPCKLYHGAGL